MESRSRTPVRAATLVGMSNHSSRPTIRTQADLELAWRTLMEPLGFASRGMWLMFIESDGRPLRRLGQVEELPDELTPEELGSLADFLGHLPAAQGARLAILLTRPGPGGLTAADRQWASGVYEACHRAGVTTEVLHLATDTDLLPVPLDELPVPASA